MRLPCALSEVNAEVRHRREAGMCSEICDVVPLVLRDDHYGPFLRLHVVMKDGSHFDVDTLECANLLQQPRAN